MNALSELANRAQMERATTVVRATYSIAPKTAQATVIGDGLAMVGGLPSTTNIAGGANINTTVTVANVGRPSAALYRGDDSGTAIIAAASASSSGSGSSGTLSAAHRLDDTTIHLGSLAETQAPWFGEHVADPDAHHAQQHYLDGTDHLGTLSWSKVDKTGSSLAHLVTRLYDDLQSRTHLITGPDHSILASKWDLVGAAGNNSLGLLTPSADVTTAVLESILKTDDAGTITLVKATTVQNLRTPQIDSYPGQTMLITPGNYLDLKPTGGLVRARATTHLQSDHYASQTTGWRMTYQGELDARYLYADQLHARQFIAELVQANAGIHITTKSVGRLAADFVAPGPGATATIILEDIPEAPGLPLFESGDFIDVRAFSHPQAGELLIADCWGTVSAPVNNGDGTQSWTFTRSVDAGATETITLAGATSATNAGS